MHSILFTSSLSPSRTLKTEKSKSLPFSVGGEAMVTNDWCIINSNINKVQAGKDQEKAQSEKDSHSKNQGGKKPN